MRVGRQGRPPTTFFDGSFRIPWDPLKLSLFLLTLVTISRIHQHFSVIGKARPALLLFLFAAAYALLNQRRLNPKAVLDTWPGRLVLAIAVAACLSVPFGLSIGNSARFIIQSYSKVLIYAFLLMMVLRSARDLSQFIWAYVVSAAILVWMSFSVFDLWEGSVRRLGRLYMYDANDLGLILVVGIPLTLWALQSSRGASRLLAASVLIGIGMSLARTGSRGGFLGLLAVGMALLLLSPGVSVVKRVSFAVALFLGILLAAPEGYWEQMKTLTEPTSDYNWTDPNGRKQLAIRGIGYMMDRPLFGIGVDNFRKAEGTLSDKARKAAPGEGIRWAAAYNSFVQAGAEMGVPGLILWSALPFWGIIAMIRLRRRLPRNWKRGTAEERFLYLGTVYLPVALIGFAVTAFFVSFAYMDPIYVLAAFMTGMYSSVQSRLALRRGPGPEQMMNDVAFGARVRRPALR